MFLYKLFSFKSAEALSDFFDSIDFDIVLICWMYTNSKYFLGIRCNADDNDSLEALVSSYEVNYKNKKK